MESSIWVAVMTCSPALYPFLIMIFWIGGSSSSGISTPISPRATMMPSDTLRISSRWSTPSAFSILEMIRISWSLFFSSSRRICSASSAQRTNDAAIKSASISTANAISDRSRSLKNGMDRCTPGTLIPLWAEMVPPFKTVHRISVSVTWSTTMSISPSSINMWQPRQTSFGRPAYWINPTLSSPTVSLVVSVYTLPAFSSTFGV